MNRDYPSMVRGMTRSAEPLNIKRLSVVLVVSLGLLVAAILAFESFEFPAFYGVGNLGTSKSFIFILLSKLLVFVWIFFNPFNCPSYDCRLIVDVKNPSVVPDFFAVGIVIGVASLVVSLLIPIVPRSCLCIKALSTSKSFSAFFLLEHFSANLT